jgi:hypothetical protein
MTFLRTSAALLACFPLGSCSIVYPVKAYFLDGQLAFSNEDVGLDSRWCGVYQFNLLDGEGRRAWSFQRAIGRPVDRRCKDGSPLIYGKAPSGAEVDKPAEPLRTGTIYVIDGSASGRLEGAFTFYRGGGKLVVRNLPTDSEEVTAILNDSFWRNRQRRAAAK